MYVFELQLFFTYGTMNLFFQGLHGIEEDVFLSLPCVLGENGVTHIIKQLLTDEETKQLHNSAKTMAKVIEGLKF